MDEQRRTFVITGLLVILFLALIFGLVFYLVNSFRNSRSTTSVPSQSPATNNGIFPRATSQGSAPSPSSRNTASPTPTPNTNFKIYNGVTFQFQYPKSWGILTCSNSENIELDPTAIADNKDFACERALKPVTILVDTNPNCQGETVKIGNINVIKSKTGTFPEADYRWCTKTTPTLDITHRVSASGARATSKTDYSSAVEEFIKTLTFTRGS